jgi:hypothetical protein
MKLESYAAKCTTCHGNRYIENNILCPTCRGDGAIVIRPRKLQSDISREKLISLFWMLAVIVAVMLAVAMWPTL